MAREDARRLVDRVMDGGMSRGEFVRKALALGISISGVNAVLAAVAPSPATAQSSGAYSLLLSQLSNRSGSVALDSATVSGIVYVFTSPDSGTLRVRFYLDNPAMNGTPRRTETTAPYDFAGGTAARANAFDTGTVSDGAHTITAAVDLVGGGTEVVNATFNVANNAGNPGVADQVHLAWVADPATTLTVVWRTMNTSTPSLVQYRVVGSSAWLQATGAQRTSGTAGKLHQTNLTGLSPSTAYEYRVMGDGGLWSDVYSTRTAPPTGSAGDFDAIYVADTGLVGGSDALTEGTQQVIDEIVALNPLLVLPGGDYAYYKTDKRYGTHEATIDAWFDQMQPLASRSPLMPTYGNHDIGLDETYQPWANRFPTPNGWNSRRAYSFDVGDVHFISVFAVSNLNPLGAAQLTWLKNDIAAARAAGRRWIIPYMHIPSFSDGQNHSSNLNLRAQLGPVFEENGIKVVFTAHDQAYERTYPLRNIGTSPTPTSTSTDCYEMSDGVTWVKASPGGKASNVSGGFSPFVNDPPPAWTAYRNNTRYVFTRLSVRASGSIRVDAYGVTGDGTPPVIMDSFQYNVNGCS